MEALEDWELLGDGTLPTHEGKPPQAPPVPAGRELLAQKSPDGGFVREIEVASPGFTPADREVEAPSKAQLARSGELLMGGTGGNPCEEEKGQRGGEEEEEGEGQDPPRQVGGKEKASEIVEKGCWEGFGFGVLCAIGAAAATTIGLLVLSGGHQQKHHQQNQKLHFQIRHDDRSMKQVMQQTTPLNQAISVVKAVPMSRAHLSFGSHYDAI